MWEQNSSSLGQRKPVLSNSSEFSFGSTGKQKRISKYSSPKSDINTSNDSGSSDYFNFAQSYDTRGSGNSRSSKFTDSWASKPNENTARFSGDFDSDIRGGTINKEKLFDSENGSYEFPNHFGTRPRGSPRRSDEQTTDKLFDMHSPGPRRSTSPLPTGRSSPKRHEASNVSAFNYDFDDQSSAESSRRSPPSASKVGSKVDPFEYVAKTEFNFTEKNSFDTRHCISMDDGEEGFDDDLHIGGVIVMGPPMQRHGSPATMKPKVVEEDVIYASDDVIPWNVPNRKGPSMSFDDGSKKHYVDSSDDNDDDSTVNIPVGKFSTSALTGTSTYSHSSSSPTKREGVGRRTSELSRSAPKYNVNKMLDDDSDSDNDFDNHRNRTLVRKGSCTEEPKPVHEIERKFTTVPAASLEDLNDSDEEVDIKFEDLHDAFKKCCSDEKQKNANILRLSELIRWSLGAPSLAEKVLKVLGQRSSEDSTVSWTIVQQMASPYITSIPKKEKAESSKNNASISVISLNDDLSVDDNSVSFVKPPQPVRKVANASDMHSNSSILSIPNMTQHDDSGVLNVSVESKQKSYNAAVGTDYQHDKNISTSLHDSPYHSGDEKRGSDQWSKPPNDGHLTKANQDSSNIFDNSISWSMSNPQESQLSFEDSYSRNNQEQQRGTADSGKNDDSLFGLSNSMAITPVVRKENAADQSTGNSVKPRSMMDDSSIAFGNDTPYSGGNLEDDSEDDGSMQDVARIEESGHLLNVEPQEVNDMQPYPGGMSPRVSQEHLEQQRSISGNNTYNVPKKASYPSRGMFSMTAVETSYEDSSIANSSVHRTSSQMDQMMRSDDTFATVEEDQVTTENTVKNKQLESVGKGEDVEDGCRMEEVSLVNSPRGQGALSVDSTHRHLPNNESEKKGGGVDNADATSQRRPSSELQDQGAMQRFFDKYLVRSRSNSEASVGSNRDSEATATVYDDACTTAPSSMKSSIKVPPTKQNNVQMGIAAKAGSAKRNSFSQIVSSWIPGGKDKSKSATADVGSQEQEGVAMTADVVVPSGSSTPSAPQHDTPSQRSDCAVPDETSDYRRTNNKPHSSLMKSYDGPIVTQETHNPRPAMSEDNAKAVPVAKQEMSSNKPMLVSSSIPAPVVSSGELYENTIPANVVPSNQFPIHKSHSLNVSGVGGTPGMSMPSDRFPCRGALAAFIRDEHLQVYNTPCAGTLDGHDASSENVISPEEKLKNALLRCAQRTPIVRKVDANTDDAKPDTEVLVVDNGEKLLGLIHVDDSATPVHQPLEPANKAPHRVKFQKPTVFTTPYDNFMYYLHQTQPETPEVFVKLLTHADSGTPLINEGTHLRGNDFSKFPHEQSEYAKVAGVLCCGYLGKKSSSGLWKQEYYEVTCVPCPAPIAPTDGSVCAINYKYDLRGYVKCLSTCWGNIPVLLKRHVNLGTSSVDARVSLEASMALESSCDSELVSVVTDSAPVKRGLEFSLTWAVALAGEKNSNTEFTAAHTAKEFIKVNVMKAECAEDRLRWVTTLSPHCRINNCK